MPRARARPRPAAGRPVVCDARILGGKPVIEGTRISVEHVLGLIPRGMTVAAIVKSYAHLTAADVRGAVAYAREALRQDVVIDRPD